MDNLETPMLGLLDDMRRRVIGEAAIAVDTPDLARSRPFTTAYLNDADSRLKLSEVVVQLESEITAATEIKYIKIFCTINPQLLLE
ncbi:hypothetical protein ACCS92_16205 [Rhizobium ruizarguesonis]